MSRMKRTVLACQTASQVLGMDCQCGMPRYAAHPINRAPSSTPAATVTAGQRLTASASASRSRKRASSSCKPVATAHVTAKAASAVQPFQGIPSAP
ncbi:Uncharacterised protein [Mycobacterium tuberculosis]|uniref:Uncharacterized protein n=1 Tax=Mycobacterium tuberculosis TaxID=1773 RepID=A0A0T9C5A4_MYCTX|nr:Uncharacterised protein [Mycobacterium tuberculosis]CFR40447.1 Uncharacterised protein [Mycobacterium tuberculosis]CFR88467.1 Uncharacterised protein [Mycobacterium tuberculosis]CFR90657.1 Uncharacterised protein [Mycobacterium tuberculosis]CFS16074.1 Uncharacterised protein [Mycobacterium tuberculosis]